MERARKPIRRLASAYERFQLWCASLLERPTLFISVVIMEFYLLALVMIVISALFFTITPPAQNAILALFFIAAAIQFTAGTNYWSDPRHIADMATRARKNADKPPTDFSQNTFWLRHCLLGLTRLGRSRAGGHFTDIVLTTFYVKRQQSKELPSLKKMRTGIEMQMAWELSSLKNTQASQSSLHFCDEIARYKESPSPSVGEISDLIVTQYLSLDSNVKTRLDAKEEKLRLDQIQWRIVRFEFIKLLATLTPLILYSIAAIMGWQSPVG